MSVLKSRATRIFFAAACGIGISLAAYMVLSARREQTRFPPLKVLPPSVADGPRSFPLPSDLISALQTPQDFLVGHRVSDIPRPVQVAFAGAAHVTKFSMAEPNARWQASDVIVEPSLPWRRLTAVATSSKLCVVFYERGGIARSDHIAVFRLTKGEAEPVWHAFLPVVATDLTELRLAIEKGKVIDGAGYF